MKQLTDLEICKRIAKIEGSILVTVFETHINAMFSYEIANLKSKHTTNNYNPLIDDALCFELLKKHDIDLVKDFQGMYSACINPYYSFAGEIESYEFEGYHESPNKAICLVIIEANEHKNKAA